MNFFSLYKRNFLYRIKKKINIDNEINLKKKSLENLFSYYGTDKANLWGKDKTKGHGYSKYYEKHLFQLKEKSINLLEIGSYSGSSAASFAKYFTQANIFCIDINISNFKFYSKRINVFGMDVSNKKSILDFYKKINLKKEENFFDIIIDDGSHKLSDILLTLNNFFLNLNKGGFYIIEDFKFPNYFKHLNDTNEVMVDELLEKIENKEDFYSSIISNEVIRNLKNNTKINCYKGNSGYSDIVFIEKT